VIRRHVLAALATGVEAGDDDAARAALASTDWVLRGAARRSFERALIDAALVSNAMVTASDIEGMRHVLRVAALCVAKNDVDATDRGEVTDAYAKLPPARPTTAPVATIALGVAAALVALSLVWAVVAIRRPHHHTRAPAPLVAGAYLTGGTPARDAELERLFVTELPSLVVQTDADRHTGRDARKPDVRLLRESKLIAARGTALAAAWRDMIDALDRTVDIAVKSHGFHDAESELRASTQAVSDQLAALGIGYHLEADVLTDKRTAHAAIFVYRVEDVVYVRAGGEPRRVLSLRRLDRLNMTHAVLGMQTEELGDPVVLLDQIDDFVERRVLPIVGEGYDYLDGERVSVGAPFTIGDDSYFHSARGLELSRVASEAIHRELNPIFARGGADAVRAAVVASVRRHEARHGLDNDRDEPLRYPAALLANVGPGDGKTARFVLRARAELAAYTSQIASDPVIPQLALWNLANLGFTKERWGTAESYVAVVVIEGLATHLGIATKGPVVHDGQLDRARLAALAAPLAAVPDDQLRAAARELWLDFYGEPFMAIVDPDRLSATLGS
jgi:hypothetical protein